MQLASLLYNSGVSDTATRPGKEVSPLAEDTVADTLNKNINYAISNQLRHILDLAAC
jgi:hypothetical protein